MSFCLVAAKHPFPAFSSEMAHFVPRLPLNCFKDKNLWGPIDSEDLSSDSFFN